MKFCGAHCFHTFIFKDYTNSVLFHFDLQLFVKSQNQAKRLSIFLVSSPVSWARPLLHLYSYLAVISSRQLAIKKELSLQKLWAYYAIMSSFYSSFFMSSSTSAALLFLLTLGKCRLSSSSWLTKLLSFWLTCWLNSLE